MNANAGAGSSPSIAEIMRESTGFMWIRRAIDKYYAGPNAMTDEQIENVKATIARQLPIYNWESSFTLLSLTSDYLQANSSQGVPIGLNLEFRDEAPHRGIGGYVWVALFYDYDGDKPELFVADMSPEGLMMKIVRNFVREVCDGEIPSKEDFEAYWEYFPDPDLHLALSRALYEGSDYVKHGMRVFLAQSFGRWYIRRLAL